jgi:rod shape-determining protein MreD
MRKALLAGCLLAVAVVAQLTLLNGLRLPGGGVPDLVLVVGAALALTQGPLYGPVAGFTAGLCIDVAPPASQLIGQYALVFCLAGWAAGRASRVAARSAISSVLLLSLVVAAGEALIAVVGLALEPAQVTLAQVRQVLPSTVGYDLLLGPFVLSVVLLLSSLLDRRPAAQPETSSLLAARARRKRTARTHQPRLVHAAGRPGDGWVGHVTRRQLGSPAAARRLLRLHPASGVAGSASGLPHPRAIPAVPVNLRLASRRRGDAAIGSAVGVGLASKSRQIGRHPGSLASARREFRPRGGVHGGSAAAHPSLGPQRPAGRTSIRFSGHRGDATVGRLLGKSRGPQRPAGPISIRFSGHRGDATVGRLLGKSRGPQRLAGPTSIRFSGHRGDATVGRLLGKSMAGGGLLAGTAAGRIHPAGTRTASVPRLRFAAHKAPMTHRPASAPRFRRRSDRIRISALAFGVRPGGALDEQAFRSMRKRSAASPRLRLHSTRAGMLGGSGRGPALAPRPPVFGLLSRRATGRVAKTPRFGYRRRSLLSVLARNGAGGRWLAARRAGSRTGASLLVRRTGGSR